MPSIRTLGIEIARVSGAEELVLCPFHEDRKPSAWFNPKKNLFYCAVCNKGMTYRQLAYALGQEIEDEETVLDEDPLDDFDLTEPETMNLGVSKYHHDYMKQRKVSEEVAAVYQVRWKPSEPEAIVMPITDVRNHTLGVCYRYTNPLEAGSRYKIIGKTTPIWPMHLLPKVVENDYMIITEGVFSAMRLATYCLEKEKVAGNFFALMGAKANEGIVEATKQYKPIFIYDNDEAGRNACRKMRKLAPHYHSFVVPLSPDDMWDKHMPEFFGKIQKAVLRK